MWAHAVILLGSILLDCYIQPEYDEPDQLKMGRVSLLMLDAVLLLGRLANRDKSLSESLRSICTSQHTHWLSTVTAGSMLCTSLAHRISHSLILLCSLTLDGEHSASKQNLIWSGRGWEEINSELGVCDVLDILQITCIHAHMPLQRFQALVKFIFFNCL